MAVLQFQPLRLGIGEVTPEELQATLSGFVAEGLRVKLATGNLLTGSLIVKLVDEPDAESASLDPDGVPYPTLPVVPSDVEAVTADVETLVRALSPRLDGEATVLVKGSRSARMERVIAALVDGVPDAPAATPAARPTGTDAVRPVPPPAPPPGPLPATASDADEGGERRRRRGAEAAAAAPRLRGDKGKGRRGRGRGRSARAGGGRTPPELAS
mgnify:CR=1 FL=1